MIKTFSVGGRVDGYPDMVYLSQEVNSYVHTLQCNGWEILDINQIVGILPFDYWDRREYFEYKITCSRPDPDLDIIFNTSKERKL